MSPTERRIFNATMFQLGPRHRCHFRKVTSDWAKGVAVYACPCFTHCGRLSDGAWLVLLCNGKRVYK